MIMAMGAALSKGMSLPKKVGMWFFSFLVIGFCMAYYANMPLVPIISGGVGTLVVTVARHFLVKK